MPNQADRVASAKWLACVVHMKQKVEQDGSRFAAGATAGAIAAVGLQPFDVVKTQQQAARAQRISDHLVWRANAQLVTHGIVHNQQ